MKHELITYQFEGKNYKGYLAFPKNDEVGHHPAIIVAHAWMGLNDFARQKAEELAQLGYIGFAADLYGEGKTATNTDQAAALMAPLFEDRALLQKIIVGALDFIRKHPKVDPLKIGAIGFCFGGLAVIELLRSGADVKGVVSFHGVLGSQMDKLKAKTVPIAKSIKGSLLVLHGYEDPLVSEKDIQVFQKEMNEGKVDWQMNVYGHTSHAFTNPDAQDPEHGLLYNPKSCDRAWWAMIHFFSECFGLAKTMQKL